MILANIMASESLKPLSEIDKLDFIRNVRDPKDRCIIALLHMVYSYNLLWLDKNDYLNGQSIKKCV